MLPTAQQNRTKVTTAPSKFRRTDDKTKTKTKTKENKKRGKRKEVKSKWPVQENNGRGCTTLLTKVFLITVQLMVHLLG